MRLNEKKVVVFIIFLLLFLFLGNIAWAQPTTKSGIEKFNEGLKDTGAGIGYTKLDAKSETIAGYIGTIISAFLGFIGIAFMFMIFLGAFDIAGSGGNEEEVKKGKGRIKDGAIGILIVFSAYVLASTILFVVSGGGIINKFIN